MQTTLEIADLAVAKAIGECTMSLALTFIASLVGGVVASLIAITIWERYREARLVITIPDKKPGEEPAIQPLGDQAIRAFYHLTVTNDGRSPAYSCRITAKFVDGSANEQLFELNGKWDRGPQPLIYAPVPTQVLPDGRIKTVLGETRQDFLIPFAETIDIQPKASENFCILVKYENEEECYAFSSWSYLKGVGHKVSEWKLGLGEYIADIQVTYCGKKSTTEKFLITNCTTSMEDIEIALQQGTTIGQT